MSKSADSLIYQALTKATRDQFAWNRQGAVRAMTRFDNGLDVFGEDLRRLASDAADFGVQAAAIDALIQFRQDAPVRDELLRTLKNVILSKDERSIALGLLAGPLQWRGQLIPVLGEVAGNDEDPLAPAAKYMLDELIQSTDGMRAPSDR